MSHPSTPSHDTFESFSGIAASLGAAETESEPILQTNAPDSGSSPKLPAVGNDNVPLPPRAAAPPVSTAAKLRHLLASAYSKPEGLTDLWRLVSEPSTPLAPGVTTGQLRAALLTIEQVTGPLDPQQMPPHLRGIHTPSGARSCNFFGAAHPLPQQQTTPSPPPATTASRVDAPSPSSPSVETSSPPTVPAASKEKQVVAPQGGELVASGGGGSKDRAAGPTTPTPQTNMDQTDNADPDAPKVSTQITIHVAGKAVSVASPTAMLARASDPSTPAEVVRTFFVAPPKQSGVVEGVPDGRSPLKGCFVKPDAAAPDHMRFAALLIPRLRELAAPPDDGDISQLATEVGMAAPGSLMRKTAAAAADAMQGAKFGGKPGLIQVTPEVGAAEEAARALAQLGLTVVDGPSVEELGT